MMPGLRVAYILLWFPEPSQTFVLDEVNTLVRLGLNIKVYTLYGPRPASFIAGMGQVLAPVRRLSSLVPPVQQPRSHSRCGPVGVDTPAG